MLRTSRVSSTRVHCFKPTPALISTIEHLSMLDLNDLVDPEILDDALPESHFFASDENTLFGSSDDLKSFSDDDCMDFDDSINKGACQMDASPVAPQLVFKDGGNDDNNAMDASPVISSSNTFVNVVVGCIGRGLGFLRLA